MKKIITNILLLLILVFYCKPQSICDQPDLCDVKISNTIEMYENSIFAHPINPNIILNANIAKTLSKIGAYVSTDGGLTWYGGILLENEQYAPRTDPATAIDLNGRMYIGGLDYNSAQSVAWSSDNGITWHAVHIPTIGITDKNHLWVDNFSISFNGRIYSSWTNNGNKDVQISYSVNQGISWSEPQTISRGNDLKWGVNIQTDANGNAYIIWPIHGLTFTWNGIGLAKSTDGGDNWYVIDNICPYSGCINSHTGNNIGPSMTINMTTSRLYIVWAETETPDEGLYGPNADIKMIYSDDQGESWSFPPITVNQITTNNQWYPWISCDPATGNLACIYYDNHEDINSVNTYVSISTDNGVNWCEMLISNNSGTGTGGLGHYIGIQYNHGNLYPCWSANINGTYAYFSPIPNDLIIYPPITQLYYFASRSILTSGDFSISQPIYTTFEAGYSIDLNDGFMADLGSDFTAKVTDCEGSGKISDINGGFVFNRFNKGKDKLKAENKPYEFKLMQNYPNPFNPETRIDYSLKNSTIVKLTIYDILGRIIKTLVNDYQQAGPQSVIWDGTNNNGLMVSTGVYIYKIQDGSFVSTRKMLLIR